ncbi:interferon beta-like [Notamacropus eugenii]|uniref:interferon beta-like n=1 Tax=Notamacropus eugenii TaxID=9315 RepID=UPI003B67A9ED
MANSSMVQLVLLLFLSAAVSSDQYDSLRFHQRRTNHRSLSLLKEMIGEIHPECLREGMNFKVPREIVQPKQCQKENATMVIHEMLQHIFLLFSSKNASPGVNETITETFLSGIYQQMVHLEMALEEEMHQVNSIWGSEDSTLPLNNYYQGIMNYLKSKEYSSCAWKRVQVEIRRNFVFLNNWTECLKN